MFAERERTSSLVLVVSPRLFREIDSNLNIDSNQVLK